MAPVTNLHRLVWGGRLFTSETWSCSLYLGSDAGLNVAANSFVAPLTAWMLRVGSGVSNQAKLDFVKFNDINPITGRYLPGPSNELLQNDMAVGNAAAGAPQLTVAVSTRTDLPRGRAHAGRFYPPTGAVSSYDSTGRISDAAALACATSAATLLQAINGVVGVTARVVVFSKIGQQVQVVNALRVGRVTDTMRSRRRQLAEEYKQVAV